MLTVNILSIISILQLSPALIVLVKGPRNRIPSLVIYISIKFLLKIATLQISFHLKTFNNSISCISLNLTIHYVTLIFLFFNFFCAHYQRHSIAIIYGHRGLCYGEKRALNSICGYSVVPVLIACVISRESYLNDKCYFNNAMKYSIISLYFLVVPCCIYFYYGIFKILKNLQVDKVQRIQDVSRYLEQFRMYFVYFILFLTNIIFFIVSMSFDNNSHFHLKYLIFDNLSFGVLMFFNYFVFNTNQILARYYIKVK